MTEAELVFTHILQCDRTALYLEKDVLWDKSVSSRIASVLRRRMAGEPLAYILGSQGFMGFDFAVDPSVLIPRMETEILVETAVRFLSRGVEHRRARTPAHQGAGAPRQQCTGLRILDIGTGSGNIAVSLARMLPGVMIDALDISGDALAVARKNAHLNEAGENIRFIHSDLFNCSFELGVAGYDLIISNPPYIPAGEIAYVQPEVRHEPHVALDGGKDGLDLYRRMTAEAPAYLKDGGLLILEIGFGQRESVEGILRGKDAFIVEEIVKDYSGIERVVVARVRVKS